MSESPKTITRGELYQRIWKTPAIHLAKEFGITSAALTKLCRELNVPKPGPGYWTLVKKGLAAEPDPLPAETNETAKEVVLQTTASDRGESESKNGIKTDQPKIPVADTLHGAHPAISKTRRLLERTKAERTGLVEMPWRESMLCVSVSKAQIHRALRILDAVIKAIEARGGTFEKRDEQGSPLMHPKIGDDFVGIGISEKVNKTERKPKDEKEKESWMWQYDKWQYQPTGKLKFQIFESEPKGGRKSWSDCSLYDLEEKLAEIVDWIFVAAEAVRKKRLRWEEIQRKREEEHQIWIEKERRRTIEERHREKLVEQSGHWVTTQNVRAFIEACEKELLGSREALPADCWETQWLTWARHHADRIDPIACGFLEKERLRFIQNDCET